MNIRNRKSKLWKVFSVSLVSFFLVISTIAPAVHAEESRDILSILKAKGLLTDAEIDEAKRSRAKKLHGKFDNGFKWGQGDKLGKMRLGGTVQADMNFFTQEHIKDTSFFVRRARLAVSGKIYEYYTWKVQVDYGSRDGVSPKDLWINLNYDKRFQVKFGQYKEPFSMDMLTSSKHTEYKERSTIANTMAPGRDLGFMVHGLFMSNTIGYAVGVFNGSGSNMKEDADGDKDIAGRLWFEPKGIIPGKLHVGGAMTWGERSKGLKDFKVAGSSTKLIAMDSTVLNGDDMDLLRLGAELSYGYGPFRATSEYMRVEYDDVKVLDAAGAVTSRENLYVQGAYANLSWFVTGEERNIKKGTFRRLKPIRNFNPRTGGLGAWELKAGYEWIEADNGWFASGLSGSNAMDGYKAGITWYHNPMFKIILDYVYNDYEDEIVAQNNGNTDDDEHMVWMRFSLEY